MSDKLRTKAEHADSVAGAARFTPGPWDRIVKMDGFTAVGAKALIARVFSVAFRDFENEAANARLIAAAPDLLAALEKLAAWPESYPANANIQRMRDYAAKVIAIAAE